VWQYDGVPGTLGLQSLIYFGIAAGALALAMSLLYARFVRKDAQAIQSGGGYVFFAAFMVIFSMGAVVAGIVALQAGR
jgi:hypothetical protein